MANFNNQQPNKTQAGTNIQEVRQQNAQAGGAGQYGTEFASETNAAEVKKQNQQSQANAGQGAQGQFGTEFASETNAAEVRRQNQQSQQGSSQQ